MKTHRLHVVIPAELHDRLKAAAAQAGAEEGETVHVTQWVRRALEAALARL